MDTLSKKSSLSCNDVCRIIRESRQNGVHKLKFDGLEISFISIYKDEKVTSTASEIVAQVSATEIAAIQEKENSKALVQEELKLKQQYLDELILQDPYKLEELIARGDIEEDLDDGDE